MGSFLFDGIRCLAMELKNKVAVITGGARIGQTIALELARRGCHIVLTYRSSKSAAEQTVNEAKQFGGKAFSLKADLAKPHQAEKVASRIGKSMGRLDVLVHMVSRYEKTSVKDLTDRIWDEQLETDLGSAYRMAIHTSPMMKRQGGGRMIFFSDWVAVSGRPRYKDFLPYYVAKQGIVGLVEALALELAPMVLVNAIAPGPILKPPGLTKQEEEGVTKVTPLGRWGGPQEIAKAVRFLVETDFVTGECIRVDGGRHLY